jgi:chemotaxis protein CheC
VFTVIETHERRMDYEVDVRKLELFNKMAKEGAETVSDHLNQLSGLNTEIEVSKINFLDMDDVRTHLGDHEQVGIYVELQEPPNGYVLFMLEPTGSKRLARGMIGEMGGDEEADGLFTDMERSAMQEIGNIMTSGFIDGWANVLDTTIDMSTPSFVFGPAGDIVDEMGGWPDEEIAFVVDSTIVATDTDVAVTVYTFPKLVDLVGLIQDIDVTTNVAEDTTASDVV